MHEGHAPQAETPRRKPPQGGGGAAPVRADRADDARPSALALARDIYRDLVTNPAFASKDAAHLAYDAIQKARVFFDAAAEHLK